MWIAAQIDDDKEIVNPEYVSLPSDSYVWVRAKGRSDDVVMKCRVPASFNITHFAPVEHPGIAS